MAYTGNSIVDYLKSVGQNSSYQARAKLAPQYGIGGYTGTAQQNLKLLSLLRSGAKPATTTTVATAPTATTTQVKATAPKAVSPSTSAYNNLQTLINNKPGEYAASPYSQQVTDVLNQIKGRNFTYDFNVDPLYQTAKNKYMEQGQKAMMDTMGNAAALTGGYGNSYATTAGQQTYQDNLSQINNVIPELYNAAYSKYSDEGNKLINQFEMLNGLEQQNYNRYLDKVNQYNESVNNAYNIYDNERSVERQKEQDAIALKQAAAKAASSSSSASAKEKTLTQTVLDKALEAINNDSWEGAGVAALDKYAEQLELLGYGESQIESVIDYAMKNRDARPTGAAARRRYN